MNCKPLAHPMSFANNYPLEQMLREVATLERQPHKGLMDLITPKFAQEKSVR